MALFSGSMPGVYTLLYWTILASVAHHGSVFAGVCSTNCNCSSESVPLLGDKVYFALRCSDDDIDVENASRADIFYYTSSDLSSVGVMDTNILHNFNNLKYLVIDGGVQSLTFIPQIASLRILHITHTYISYIADDVIFRISRNLLSLSLAYNEIEVISDDAFAGLDNLQTLNLSHNRMGKVPSALLKSLPNLNTLDLSHNSIRSVSSAEFDGLHSLLWLNLTDNIINSLEFIQFPGSGVSLSVKNNPLNHFAWHANTDAKLSSLEIGSHFLLEIKTNTFANAIIGKLSITNCSQLRLVDAHVFVNSTVANVSVTNNPQLEFIDPKAFSNLINLKDVDISYNKLRSIPETFSQLPSLDSVLAIGNPLLCDCTMSWLSDTDIEVNVGSSFNSSCKADIIQSVCTPRLLYRTSNLTTIDEGTSTTLRCKVGQSEYLNTFLNQQLNNYNFGYNIL